MKFRVDSVESGSAAIKSVLAAAEAGDPYAVVFIDRQMANVDGLATAQAINGLGLSPAPRLVMVTVYGGEDVVKQAPEAGIGEVLIKPLTPSLVFDCVVRLMGATAQAEGNPDKDTERNLEALRGIKVLLCEDNEFNQQVASEMLVQAGLLVDIADNGAAAVEKVQADAFDVVLMDMQMPVMDGLAATREIRRLGFKTLPIIAMTANAMQADKEQCLAAGMNAHLAKPIDPDGLWSTLVAWVLPPVSASEPPFVTAPEPAPPPKADAVPADIPKIDPEIFDFEIIGPIYKWNAVKLRKILAGFLGDTEGKVAALDSAFATAEPAALRQMAHSLKGTARTAGAARLGTLASDIEKAAKDGNMIVARELAPQIGPAMKELRDTLAPFLATPS